MAESAQYINSLVETSPSGDDYKYDGAAHMRVVKSAVKNTFANINGAVSVTPAEMNYLSGVSTNVQTQIQTISATAYSIAGRLADLESLGGVASISYSANQTYINAGRDTTPKHWGSYSLGNGGYTLSGVTGVDIHLNGILLNESTASIISGANPYIVVPSGVSKMNVFGRIAQKHYFCEVSNPKNLVLRRVCYGDNLYVSVGNTDATDAYIITSSNTRTWTERSNPKSLGLYGITYGNGLYVSVGVTDGSDAYIVTSSDGITWTERSNPKSFDLYGVTYGNGIYVAVGAEDGSDAYIVTSSDGITWTEQSNPSNTYLFDVIYSNGLFIAVGGAGGTDAYIITSPDGTTWTERSNPTNVYLSGVTYGNGIYVAVGNIDSGDAYIITSPDGTTWTERSNPKNTPLLDVAFGDGYFIAVGANDGTDSYIVKSNDGITWSEMTNPQNLILRGITYSKGSFVACGNADATDAYIVTLKNTASVTLYNSSPFLYLTLDYENISNQSKYVNGFNLTDFRFRELSVSSSENYYLYIHSTNGYKFELTATSVAGSWVGVEFR